MTAPGSRKTLPNGRSDTQLKPHRQNQIEGAFVAHQRDLLESPAWRILNLVDRRILDRLEIEHLQHAGRENGSLVCTFTDFEGFGIRRDSIAASIRRLEALGLIEVIARGRFAGMDIRVPSRYRLTYVMGNTAPTNDWRAIDTIEKARAAVSRASAKTKSRTRNRALDKAQNPDHSDQIPRHKNGTTGQGTKTCLLSISRGERGRGTCAA